MKTILLEFVKHKLTSSAVVDLADELRIWQKLVRAFPADQQWLGTLTDRLTARVRSCPDVEFLTFFSRGDTNEYLPAIQQLIETTVSSTFPSHS